MSDVNIDVTFSPQLEHLGERFDAANEKALNRVIELAENEANRQEGKIAAQPISVSKTGRKRWNRTGELARSRQRMRPSKGERALAWMARHARRRFLLGVTPGGWMPKNPADGIIRKNNVPVDTAAIIEPQAKKVYLQELVNGMENG